MQKSKALQSRKGSQVADLKDGKEEVCLHLYAYIYYTHEERLVFNKYDIPTYPNSFLTNIPIWQNVTETNRLDKMSKFETFHENIPKTNCTTNFSRALRVTGSVYFRIRLAIHTEYILLVL